MRTAPALRCKRYKAANESDQAKNYHHDSTCAQIPIDKSSRFVGELIDVLLCCGQDQPRSRS
jgi:hypothetical protein